MAAGLGDRRDGLGADLAGKARQLAVGEGLEVLRRGDAVEEGRLGSVRHVGLPRVRPRHRSREAV